MNDILQELQHMFTNGQGGLNLWGKVATIVLVLVAIKIILSVVDHLLSKSISHTMEKTYDHSRRITLTKVASSAFHYLVYVVSGLILLQILGINTSTLIATAGVGTLVIAMGAQVLVKDIINGFFIILEGQYDVGDEVSLADLSGVVEEVGIRVTKLRDFNGSLYTIPNSEIRVVTNKNRGLMRAKVEISIDEDQPLHQVLEVFEKTLEEFNVSWKPKKGPNLWGVTATEGGGYRVTAVAYDTPQRYYELEYELRKKLLEAMEKAKIKQPATKVKQR